MVWPGPIDNYMLKRHREDGLSEREVFAELSGLNVAEWVRIVLGVDDLQAAYDAEPEKVRDLCYDVFHMGDLNEKLKDDDMCWLGMTKQPASELHYDGKSIPDVVKDRCDFTLAYPLLPCLILDDMYGKCESFLPFECLKMYHCWVTGSFWRMYRPKK
jgi:hypothetical protein